MLLGTAAIPSQATTLTGFTTTGDMMAGIQVTASFVDGTSETAIWQSTTNISGGAFGSGWSLTEAGNSFDAPWTFSNTGQAITSLVIDAIPGNSVFDNVAVKEITPGSADGWGFQTLLGLSPDASAYSEVIDTSQGDLFGKLSLYWTSGFTGMMKFRADTDTGSSNDPVKPKDPVARNTPPTVDFSLPIINEGESASTTLFATQPGENAIAFFLDGQNLGTDFRRSGIRSINADLGLFPDNGEYTYTALARDENGKYSLPVAKTLTVLNVAPTLANFQLSKIIIRQGESVFGRLLATDPGADSETFFVNGNPIGIDLDTSGTRSAFANLGTFYDVGTYTFEGIAQDKDGAFSNILTKMLRVLNVAPTIASITQNLAVQVGSLFDFTATATDPGINDLLTYNWDLNGDGLFDDYTGESGQWSFTNPGSYQIGLQVSDGNGGYDYSYFAVETAPIFSETPPSPPPPPSVTDPGSIEIPSLPLPPPSVTDPGPIEIPSLPFSPNPGSTCGAS